jgi:hypothetical protein
VGLIYWAWSSPVKSGPLSLRERVRVRAAGGTTTWGRARMPLVNQVPEVRSKQRYKEGLMSERRKEEIFFRVKCSLFAENAKHVHSLSNGKYTKHVAEFAGNANDYATPRIQQVSPHRVDVLLYLGDKVVIENDKLFYSEDDVEDAAEEALKANGYCVIEKV